MAMLYWFALIVGGGLLAASFVGDLFNSEVDGADNDANGAKILSLRNATYFLFGFGATGLALGWWGSLSGLLIAAAALAVGAVAAGSASVLLGYVGGSSSGEHESDESFVGCVGRIVLPIAADAPGRVIVQRGSREYELRARPFDTAAAGARVGANVVVVEMEGGTALVAPLEDSAAMLGLNA